MHASCQADLRPCLACGSRARYQCPRCQAFTCSLTCYKKHSLLCLDEFHSSQFRQALTGLKADDESRKSMARVLIKNRGES
jgi:hypothetical protein